MIKKGSINPIEDEEFLTLFEKINRIVIEGDDSFLTDTYSGFVESISVPLFMSRRMWHPQIMNEYNERYFRRCDGFNEIMLCVGRDYLLTSESKLNSGALFYKTMLYGMVSPCKSERHLDCVLQATRDCFESFRMMIKTDSDTHSTRFDVIGSDGSKLGAGTFFQPSLNTVALLIFVNGDISNEDAVLMREILDKVDSQHTGGKHQIRPIGTGNFNKDNVFECIKKLDDVVRQDF